MSNGNWYETENWYAPLKRTAPEKPKEPARDTLPEQEEKKSRKTFWVATIALVCAFALLLGLCMPAILRLRESGTLVEAAETEEGKTPSTPRPTRNPGGSQDKPATPSTDEPDMPDDRDAFFDSYYQDVDTSAAQVNIEQGTLPQGFTLQAVPAKGKTLSLQELYEKCAPSIVAISGYTDGQAGYNWGTGVILSADGLILTNTHVIDACDRATVTLFDDREFEATLIGADTISDVAVLKIDATGLTPAEFGDSASLRVGDPVAAIGNPLGDSFRCTLTDGIISAISRDISYKGRSMILLQTNTALNEGNSGGALFNMHGQVVGITNMKMMSSYSSIEGIGFAIPSATAVEVVNSIVRYGEVRGRPSIGITVGAIPPEAMEKYQLPSGLYITDVLESSDAWKQGVRPGDVLLEVNHIPVSTTTEVNEIKNQYGVGDTLHFTIWRNGETMEVDVLLMDTNDLYYPG